MALPVVTQPNIPAGPLPVVSQPQQPTLTPQVQNAPSQPQPQVLPVQPSPSAPQQTSLPVQAAPAGQQQSISVQLPSIVTGIQTALNRGADPAAVLQALAAQHPEMQASITEATSRGAAPQQILAQIVQQYSGISEDSPAQPQHTGFIQSLVQSLTHWATAGVGVPLYDAAAATGDLLKGDTKAAAADISKPRDLGYLGKVAPVELQSIGQGALKSFEQEAGLGAQGASLAIGNPVAAGATFGAGDALEKNKSVAGIATETGLGALGGKLGDAAVAGVSKVLSQLNEGPAAILINSLIKPLEKEFRFGKNPGLGVAQEKIIANSLPDLEKQVGQKLTEVGQKIDQHLSAPELQTKTADYSAVIKPFDDAITEAAKGGANNQALVTRLQNAKDALTQEFEIRQGNVVPKLSADTNAPITKDLTTLNPQEGNALKQDIGKLRSWKGTPSEDTVYNKAVIDAYRSANNIVESQAPGIKQLNSSYANLLSAQSAIERRTAVEARQSTFGLFDKLGFGEAALALARGDFHTAAAAMAAPLLNHTLGSTATKTRLAALLSTIPEISSKLFEASPQLQTLLTTAGKAATSAGRYTASRFGARAISKLSP